MIFSPPFPWNPNEKTNLSEFFRESLKERREKIQVKWFWEPFHRPGFEALQFAEKNGITQNEFQRNLKNLSGPSIPGWLSRRLKNKIKKETDLERLNPHFYILKTYEEAGREMDFFKNPWLPKISEIKNLARAKVGFWEPDLSGMVELTELSNWLTKNPRLSDKFYQLKVWDQLEFLEVVIGVQTSSSVLNFTRIYTE